MNFDLPKRLKRASRSLLFYAAALMFVTIIAVIWSALSATQSTPAARLHSRRLSVAQASGWGASALRIVHGSLNACPLIATANACGMGASSCFKCHSGGRGPAISNVPWHTDHAPVNNDCVGCHAGSPWILKKSLAHAGLIPNPLTQPKRCAACHKSANVRKLDAHYMKILKKMRTASTHKRT